MKISSSWRQICFPGYQDVHSIFIRHDHVYLSWKPGYFTSYELIWPVHVHSSRKPGYFTLYRINRYKYVHLSWKPGYFIEITYLRRQICFPGYQDVYSLSVNSTLSRTFILKTRIFYHTWYFDLAMYIYPENQNISR